MKMLTAILLTGLAVTASACGSSSTAPSNPTLPTSYTFTAALSPANEVPAVTNADSTGSGTSTMVMAVTRDSAGSITAATMNFSVTLTGFPTGTSLTGSHIHQAAAGTNAGVIVNTGLSSGEVVLANGAGSFTKNSVNVAVDVANNLIAGANGFYFNVHTTLNTGGAARGQLVKQ